MAPGGGWSAETTCERPRRCLRISAGARATGSEPRSPRGAGRRAVRRARVRPVPDSAARRRRRCASGTPRWQSVLPPRPRGRAIVAAATERWSARRRRCRHRALARTRMRPRVPALTAEAARRHRALTRTRMRPRVPALTAAAAMLLQALVVVFVSARGSVVAVKTTQTADARWGPRWRRGERGRVLLAQSCDGTCVQPGDSAAASAAWDSAIT